MYDYLGFPKRNIVNKNLTIEKYLNRANLTKTEQRNLSAYLDAIKLLYSFPFCDGEVIVVLSEFVMEEYNRYALSNFVKGIAQSIPFKMLLIVKCEGVLRFFVFDEKLNSKNNTRSFVSNIYFSNCIVTVKKDYFDLKFIEAMRIATEKSSNAEELYSSWCEIIKDEKCNESILDMRFDYAVSEYRDFIEKEREKAYSKGL